MNKPLILVEREMKESLVNVINEYLEKLPATMIVYALRDCVAMSEQLAENQYKQAFKEYEEGEGKNV